MTFKRAVWSSGYNYHVRCPYCTTNVTYIDKNLDYRPWYPNGFVYCPICHKPLRHNEIYAVGADGKPVYRTQGEADAALRIGYLKALGYPATAESIKREPSPSANTAAGAETGVAMEYCTNCGRAYHPGEDHFCAGCGKKLN